MRGYEDTISTARIDCGLYTNTVAIGGNLTISPNNSPTNFEWKKIWDELALDMSGTNWKLQEPLRNGVCFRLNLQFQSTGGTSPIILIAAKNPASGSWPILPNITTTANAGQGLAAGDSAFFWASHVMKSGYDLNNQLECSINVINNAAATTALTIQWISFGYELVT